MKKFALSIFALVAFTVSVQAQEGLAVKAGYNNVTIDVDGFGNESEGGFFFGVGYNFDLEESFDIEASVLYSFVEDLNSLYIPVMAKFAVAEGFTLQAGPQINFLLEDEIDDGKFGLDLAAGVGYEFTENIFAEARYGFEIARDIDDVNINTLTIGVGYRFN